MLLAGPMLCGFTQTLNDWFDREIDAINEPSRPIPSGAIGKVEVLFQIWFLFLSGIASADLLDRGSGVAGQHFITILTLMGCAVSYAYSAPPFKLKARGLLGPLSLGCSYITLPWLCGHAVFDATNITPQEIFVAILFSIGGTGIGVINDFKSIDGDKEMGLKSIPIILGVDRAKMAIIASIDLSQVSVAMYLFSIGKFNEGYTLLCLIVPQLAAQTWFWTDPFTNDVAYQAIAQPFFVSGILCTALAIGRA